MDYNEPVMHNPHDHIMANTWRLIIERESRSTLPTQPQPVPDFFNLEQLLFEYRLIGLSLAASHKRLRYD